MIVFVLIVVVFLLFISQKWWNRSSESPGGKSAKPYRYFKWFFIIAPMIAVITYLILFSTILTGRFIERSSHALIVLIIWLYTTSFYVDFVFFWKNKLNRFFCIVGMVSAVGTAILLTPLDRYVELLGSLVPIGTYILGICMSLAYYISEISPRRRN